MPKAKAYLLSSNIAVFRVISREVNIVPLPLMAEYLEHGSQKSWSSFSGFRLMEV